MAIVSTIRKSSPDIDPIVKHIDEWERVSNEQRDKVLGDGYLDEAEAFYNLADSGGNAPSFRPAVSIPELQTLMLNEANDLSESAPTIYLANDGNREQDREKAFQGIWQQAQTNFHLLMNNVGMLFNGTGAIQVGYDPDARNGKGNLWVKARSPKTFFFDPATDYEMNWSYLGLSDYMYLEQIKQRWPNTTAGLSDSSIRRSSMSPSSGASTVGFQLPDGPMTSVGGITTSPQAFQDNRHRVRYIFCLDYTRELESEKIIPKGAITQPNFRWKYPNGRMIVECGGRVIADGNNPFPMNKFPLILFWAIPPLTGAWGIPAVRYSMNIQSLAERLWTGIFENSVRLNNGVWFIDERTGINPEDFGGLPGEVRVINANSPAPTCVWPSAMPQHVIQTPQLLMEMQRKLQGFTQARQGSPGDGNISTELFDESVLRAQGMTQLRGRLGAAQLQKLAELMFYTVARYQNRMKVPYTDPKTGMSLVDWTSVARPDQYDVFLDPASVRPMSQAALRRLAPELAKSGALPVDRMLQLLGVPHADEIAKESQTQLALRALANAGNAKH